MQSCIEYCCQVCTGAPNFFLEFLDKLQKWICRTFGPLLAASPEPLGHCWNVNSLSFFYSYCFSRCLSELAQVVPLPYFRGWSTRYFYRLHDFSVTIPRFYKDSSFFLRSGLWTQDSFLVTPCLAVAVQLAQSESQLKKIQHSNLLIHTHRSIFRQHGMNFFIKL